MFSVGWDLGLLGVALGEFWSGFEMFFFGGLLVVLEVLHSFV